MNIVRCKVCREPERQRLIEADWSGGMTAEGIAKRMTAAGWSIGAETILKHLKEHAGPGAAVREPPKLSKRDAAVFVRDRVMDRMLELENGGKRQVLVKGADGMELQEVEFDILDKDLQPALGSMLKAQAIVDKREANADKRKIDLFRLMLGDGLGLAPVALSGERLALGDGNTVEGDFVDLDDDDEA